MVGGITYLLHCGQAGLQTTWSSSLKMDFQRLRLIVGELISA